MIRVLQVYKTYFPETTGGVEQVIQTLVQHSEPLGFEHSLITCTAQSSTEEKLPFLKLKRYKQTLNLASTPLSLSFLKAFKKNTQHCDIIHYHAPWPFADLCHLLNFTQKPSVVTYHSDIVKQKYINMFYQPVLKKFLNKVDAIIATSDNYRQSSPILKQFSDKCHSIPIGLSAQDYPSASLAKLAYWQAQFPKPFFLFLGVLRYYKGLHYLIEAASQTQLPVVIAGDGPLMAELKKLAQQKNCQNIYFTGFIQDEDKRALLALCKALIMPSHLRSEAFGVSLLEGLFFAKPLISTQLNTGTSFVNEHLKTGFVIPPANVPALAQAMQNLYQDDKLCQQMGQEAKIRFNSLFTAENMAQSYAAIYKKVLGL